MSYSDYVHELDELLRLTVEAADAIADAKKYRDLALHDLKKSVNQLDDRYDKAATSANSSMRDCRIILQEIGTVANSNQWSVDVLRLLPTKVSPSPVEFPLVRSLDDYEVEAHEAKIELRRQVLQILTSEERPPIQDNADVSEEMEQNLDSVGRRKRVAFAVTATTGVILIAVLLVALLI